MQLCFALVALFSALLASGSASPRSVARSHSKRASLDTSTICGIWDSKAAGQYSLNSDLWGSSGASGSQCASLIALNGDQVSWTTTYNWSDGSNIKSFTDIQLNEGINRQLSAITSMPATWAWTMSSTQVVADVAFDLFTSDYPGGSNQNEIMVWLANINSGPLSYKYNPEGKPIAAAKDISIGNYKWELYEGTNGVNKVHSFVPSSGGYITNYQGDIKEFFQYLITNQGLPQTQYLVTFQGGTEVTRGSATFTTSGYSAAVN